MCSVQQCDKDAGRRGMCIAHYQRWRRYGDPTILKRQVVFGTVEVRFWAKVNKAEGQGPRGNCWEWQARRHRQGYGQFTMNRGGERWKTVLAHRVAWELTHGAIPDGLDVLHHCDNPPCSRPIHLFLGTNADNSVDMVAKGRQSKGDSWPARRRAKGSQHYNATLNENIVRKIRRLYAKGNVSYQALADDCNVSAGAIYFAISRKTWKHVE